MHKPTSDTPGPAAYDSRKTFGTRDGGQHFSFYGKSYDKIVRDECPGPATYAPPDMALSRYGVKYSFQGKSKPRLVTEGNPGPGTYDVRETAEKTKMKISKTMGPRLTHIAGDNNTKIGPGSYQTSKSYKSSQAYMGVSYSLTGRNKTDFKSDTPGPGKYSLAYMTERSKGYEMSFKGNYKVPTQKNFVPGPGRYSHKLKTNGPGYSFSRRFLQFDSTYGSQKVAEQLLLKEPMGGQTYRPMDLSVSARNPHFVRPNTAR